MFKSSLAILTGAGITAVYFFLYNRTFVIARDMAPGAGQAVILFSYFGRLAAVGVLLVVSASVFGLDPFLTSVSFLVIYTMALLLTQGRAGLMYAGNSENGEKRLDGKG